MTKKTDQTDNAGDSSPNAIQAVERAAMILSAFTVRKPWLSLNELTAHLGTSKPTAHRYTKALRAVDLLRYDEAKALYSLGPQILALSSAARAGLPIVSAAGPFMERLMREINETVVLSVWDGSDSVVVVRAEDNTDRTTRVSIRAGTRLPLFTSAQGRVFCAYVDNDENPALARRMGRVPGLREELRHVRSTGFSVNSPDGHGTRTIAAPVFTEGHVVATIAVVGTTESISAAPESPMVRALLQTTANLASGLGS